MNSEMNNDILKHVTIETRKDAMHLFDFESLAPTNRESDDNLLNIDSDSEYDIDIPKPSYNFYSKYDIAKMVEIDSEIGIKLKLLNTHGGKDSMRVLLRYQPSIQVSKKHNRDEVKNEYKNWLILSVSELDFLFNKLNLSRAEFMTLQDNHTVIINDCKTSCITLNISSVSVLNTKKIDVRYFFYNQGKLTATKRGVSIYGYDNLTKFRASVNKLCSSIDIMNNHAIIRDFISGDIAKRFIVYNHFRQDQENKLYISTQKDSKKIAVDYVPKIRSYIAEFMYDYLAEFYNETYMRHLSCKLKSTDVFKGIDLLDYVYESVVTKVRESIYNRMLVIPEAL